MTLPKPSFDFNAKKDRNALEWRILGGNNQHQIGVNAGLCIYRDQDTSGHARRRVLLFDIGLLLGDPKKPEHPALANSDTIIPDLEKYLYKAGDPAHVPETPIDTIFITHNHMDHLGAIPLLLVQGYKIPKIYTTPYTAKRLEQELSAMGIEPDEWPEIYTIAPGKPVLEGAVRVTAFWVSHSTPQSAGFLIETPAGTILNPGDFKLDQTVLWGPAFNEDQFKRIVQKPVDLLLLDSTGAGRDVKAVTEQDVRDSLSDLIQKNPKKRFIIAVMSGYEENFASVAAVAAKHSRTLWVAGASHEQSLDALRETGMTLSDCLQRAVDVRVLSTPKSGRDLEKALPEKGLVIVTGAQGKPHAALTRAAEKRHPLLELDPDNDVIVFCAPSIPGQEASQQRLFANLRNRGFQVITRRDGDFYAHAHARIPEIAEMIRLSGAKTVLPIHGTAELREACAKIAEKMDRKILRAENGTTISVDGEKVQITKKEEAPLVGFKMLQGTNWQDRYFIITETRKAANDNKPPAPPNKKPKILKI